MELNTVLTHPITPHSDMEILRIQKRKQRGKFYVNIDPKNVACFLMDPLDLYNFGGECSKLSKYLNS